MAPANMANREVGLPVGLSLEPVLREPFSYDSTIFNPSSGGITPAAGIKPNISWRLPPADEGDPG